MNKEKLTDLYRKYENIIKAAVMAFLPLLCCMIYCAVQGGSLGSVYLPASEWNDELFYYKQVDGMIKYGFPYGYFGFNESHALKLSFAAWSPVMVLPYIIWGLLFGWNLMSPIYCNIILMMLGFFFYVVLVRPTWKQMGILALVYSLVTPITRYTLSGMPEALFFSMLTVYFGMAIRYLDSDAKVNSGEKNQWTKRKKGLLAGMLIIAALLTLMRPYLILFLLLPMGLWIYRSRRWGCIGSAVVLAGTGGVYAAIKYYLGAEYFTPLYKTEWVTTFFEKGIFAGLKYMLGQLWNMGKEFIRNIIESFHSGFPQGALFAAFVLLMLILLLQTWVEWRKKNSKELLINGYLAFCFIAMLAALLLMYKLREGSKHLITFIMIGLLALSRMDTRFFKKAMAVGLLSAYLFVYLGVDPYDYQTPFAEQEWVAEIEQWEEVLAEKLELQTENVPNYDNVVIWTFSDMVEGQSTITKWQILYTLPAGFGISCCYQDYVAENLEQLQSKYLCIPVGGELDGMCQQAGYQEVARIGETVMYQRY